MKESVRFILRLALSLVLTAKILLAQAALENAKKEIDRLFKPYDSIITPGYAIGITREAEVLLTKGYGAANLEYDIPLDENSVFSIASVSKQFTAACIALLILENKITLTTPAQKYIPALQKYPEEIQIRHLLYNTSGLVDYHRLPRPGGKSWITFNYFDIDEAINISLNLDELKFEPGERWDYCNVNYMLLVKIVEKVSGQTFREFIADRLFGPLGMYNSFINDDITEVVRNRVTPYNYRNSETIQAYRDNGIEVSTKGRFIQHHRNAPHFGGSGVMTTINDLAKWTINFTTLEFGGNEFYNLLHRTEKFRHERHNQAMGLYQGEYRGRKIYAWDGGDWGISSQILRFPSGKISIICLSNLGSGQAFRKANQIADILIKYNLL